MNDDHIGRLKEGCPVNAEDRLFRHELKEYPHLQISNPKNHKSIIRKKKTQVKKKGRSI